MLPRSDRVVGRATSRSTDTRFWSKPSKKQNLTVTHSGLFTAKATRHVVGKNGKRQGKPVPDAETSRRGPAARDCRYKAVGRGAATRLAQGQGAARAAPRAPVLLVLGQARAQGATARQSDISRSPEQDPLSVSPRSVSARARGTRRPKNPSVLGVAPVRSAVAEGEADARIRRASRSQTPTAL